MVPPPKAARCCLNEGSLPKMISSTSGRATPAIRPTGRRQVSLDSFSTTWPNAARRCRDRGSDRVVDVEVVAT